MMAKSFLSLLLVASTAQAFLQPAPGRCATARIGTSSLLSQSVAEVPTKNTDVGAEIDNPLTLELEPEPKKEDEMSFNWFKSWYPVVPVEIMDPEVPHKFQLLGMDIVVWNDAPIEGGLFGSKKKRAKNAKREAGGQWRAFVDACPHRKVPLSEGRVEDDGSLLCSYHAWRFDGQGALVSIPQVETEDELARIKSNPKSNCNAFPTQVIDGLLWVWADSGDDAMLESALKPAPICETPQNVSPDKVWCGPWNFRELPYGADFFLENVVDPAHVDVR
jgi:phenylpropionate dioxygenase-like ring-hydroxylating dioxygenase large terminal subunit